MVDTVRKENAPVLLLESGGVFSTTEPDSRLSARYMLRGMDQMGYAAMNLGGNELYAGLDFLREVAADISFPLISSNLVFKDDQAPFWKPYVIVNLGNVRVGIIGVMPVGSLEKMADPGYSENLDILAPKAALEKMVPALEKESDIIVLLSQCDFEETIALADAVKGIDFAVCPGRRRIGCADHGPQQSETNLLPAAHNGVGLGFLQFTVDGKSQVKAIAQKIIPLGSPVPGERLMSEMFNEIKSLRAKTAVSDKEAHAKAMSKLQLTPEEFIRQLQKERPEAVLIME